MKKNTLISFVFFCVLVIPSFSRAQAPFGGLEIAMAPCTCTGGSIILHLFAPLYLGTSVPITGAMTAAAGPTLYMFNLLRPGAWALGDYTPGIQACWMGVPPFCGLYPTFGFILQTTGTSL